MPPVHPRAGGLTGQVLDHRYAVERKLGEGGTSFVYLALDTESGQQVAIKVLSPQLAGDADLMQRLRREALMVGSLGHPSICRLHRLGESRDGLLYLVLDYLAGELLNDREIREGPFPLELGRSVLVDLCAGLEHAHQRRVIHRDLKPENVMLVPDATRAPGVRGVVLDFGLAKPHGAELLRLTATGVVLGTPEFMSPEQMRGRPVDHRSDIYSLAVLGFEMLTGQLPFPGRTSQEMMIARLQGQPVSLRSVRPDLPASLDHVLARALATDPSARYASMAEFGALLAAVMAPPSGGAPISWWNQG